MSLLTIVQGAADSIGLNRPTAVASSNDPQVRQLFALAKTEGNLLAQRPGVRWQSLMREATHTTLAAELQGVLTTILPGVRWPLNGTFWNRTQSEPVAGPISPAEWQSLQAFTVTGPYQDYRIRQGNLYFIPAPAAGETVGIEYLSRYWCQDSVGTDQTTWAADDDVGVLDEDIMQLGLIWRFLRAKGMDYAEELNEYELAASQAQANDGQARPVRLDHDSLMDDSPHIRVPTGSWNL